MSFLAVDIGNSSVTVGLHDNGSWIVQWRFSSKLRLSVSEWKAEISHALDEIPAYVKIENCAIASVVPELTEPWTVALNEILGSRPTVISSECFHTLSIDYEPRSAVGVDRLCGVVAGVKKFAAPLIIVDLGTATVFDVVDETRTYRGGVIAPGVATAAESLHIGTALLPKIDLTFPPSVVGISTVHAMQSGILFGALTMIDGIVALIRRETGWMGRVVATGGFADLILSRSTTIDVVEPDLVLDGIRLIAEGETW